MTIAERSAPSNSRAVTPLPPSVGVLLEVEYRILKPLEKVPLAVQLMVAAPAERSERPVMLITAGSVVALGVGLEVKVGKVNV